MSVLFIAFNLPAAADEIYTWTDENGKVHFSTSPKNKRAKPAKLPEITREDLDGKIEKIRSETPPNCVTHGGVDCTQGRDRDGSVICRDGFRDSLLPYRFACMEVQLAKSAVSRLNKESQVIEMTDNTEAHALSLSLRNNSDVTALGLRVAFQFPDGRQFEAVGPETVEPFGIGDYILHLKPLGKTVSAQLLESVEAKIRCMNCSSIRQASQ